jgi:hypothetical protein
VCARQTSSNSIWDLPEPRVVKTCDKESKCGSEKSGLIEASSSSNSSQSSPEEEPVRYPDLLKTGECLAGVEIGMVCV